MFKSKAMTAILLGIVFALSGPAHAQSVTVQMIDDAIGATNGVEWIVVDNELNRQAFPNTDDGKQALIAEMNKTPNANFSLQYQDANRNAMGPFRPLRAASNVAGSSLVACSRMSRLQPTLNSRPESGAPADVVFVFNEHGSLCYQSHTRITEGDRLTVRAYGTEDEIGKLGLDVGTCSLQPSTPSILDAIEDGVTFTSGQLSGQKIAYRDFGPNQCFDAQVTMTVKKQDGSAYAGPLSVKQYRRYRGTFQIGAVWTEFADDGFDLTDFGSGNQIRALSDDSRGPEYVGSLVIYGIPYYVKGLFGDNKNRRGIPYNYAGRDIVNEDSWKDRLGLALSFGLSDPDETLGVGLSFELVSGVNLTGTYLYQRISELDGVAVGDDFSGTKDQIPTRKTWEEDFVIGLSIDGRYLTKFFSSSSD